MAPAPIVFSTSEIFRRQSAGPVLQDANGQPTGDWRAAAQDHPEDLIVESWSQGFLVGALLVMACITIANMRRGVILHKLILLELLLAMTHGTFCFMNFKGYGWYLSSTAMLLYFSWIIHNIVAWMKVRPFFCQPGGFFKAKTGLWVKRIYLFTLALTVPVICFQISDNFRFFNNIPGGWYVQVRPYEPLMRDPWWVFTCVALFHVIRKCYGTGVIGLVKRSPRFGILLSAIVLSIIFTLLDIAASIHNFTGSTDGINPWWKLSLVFKCLTDTIMLDDFKTELKRLGVKRIQTEEARRNSVALVAEYPSALDGPEPPEHSKPRRGTLFSFHRHNHSPGRNNAYESDSITLQGSNDSNDSKDDNVDPLSEYATPRAPQARKRPQNLNDPDKDPGDLDFETALNMDPESLRPPSERENIRSTTRRISKLPGLKDFRFEAIKPGRKPSRAESASESENEKHNSEEDENTLRLRNMAEEIQRNTIMDLKAQQRQAEANKAARNENKEKEEDEKHEQEYQQRLRRFKQSIGAAEFMYD